MLVFRQVSLVQRSVAWGQIGTRCTGLFLVLALSERIFAQAESVSGEGDLEAQLSTAPLPEPAVDGTKHNEWVIAPIPTLNPSQGIGLQLVAQYIFKSEAQAEGTPSSIIAVGGAYTEQKSWALGAAYLGHWRDDLWRPLVVGGYGDFNYDFFGIGNNLAQYGKSVPVSQQAIFGVAQMLRRVLPGLYAGLRLVASSTDVSLPGLNQPPITIAPYSASITTWSAGPVLQWDSRDNQFFPTRGQLADFSAMFNDGDKSYQIYQFDWNIYHALGEGQVLAGRVFLRSAAGDVPFYALSQFGMHNDLRGYKNGQYRDNEMFATQVEYRQSLGGRWGFVVFAGVGEVAPSFSDFDSDNLLSSAGAGIRFKIAKNRPLNFRFDWAFGSDGDAFYLGVNEAF